MNDDYLKSLLVRADRAIQNRPLSEVTERLKAIVGSASAIRNNDLANAGLEALKRGRRPTPEQPAALELVVRTMRPAPLSQQGRIDDLPQAAQPVFEEWDAFRSAVSPFLYSIGRIDRAVSDNDARLGTGFLVAPQIIATNRHVLDALSYGAYQLSPGAGVIRFGAEYRTIPDEPRVGITGVVAVHPDLDMVLLSIESPPQRDERSVIRIEERDAVPGDNVVAIGYPLDDGQRNPLFIGAIFGSVFGVKRAAPGEVIEQRGDLLTHDCSTLGGNSGSPIFSMATASVVGIHASGQFLYRNEAVRGSALRGFVNAHI